MNFTLKVKIALKDSIFPKLIKYYLVEIYENAMNWPYC